MEEQDSVVILQSLQPIMQNVLYYHSSCKPGLIKCNLTELIGWLWTSFAAYVIMGF